MSASRAQEKGPPKDTVTRTDSRSDDVRSGSVVDVTAGSQALHRKLRGKEVQLFAIGGAIGTCKRHLVSPQHSFYHGDELYGASIPLLDHRLTIVVPHPHIPFSSELTTSS